MLELRTTTPATTASTDTRASRTDASPRRRLVAMSVWAALFVAAWVPVGLPTDPVYVFAWLWGAVVAWNSHRPWREHLRFARDWSPAVALLVVYTLSRGYADRGVVPHVLEMLTADVRLTGWATGGLPPTLWLQHHLYDPDTIHWWDVGVSFVYFSHFVVTPAIALVLWLRNRRHWAAFMRRWIALSAAGLATYFAYPAAPPWWAAQYGVIGQVARISTRGWDVIGLHGAGNLLNAAQLDASNPVAAMPSLHSAFALLAAAFCAPLVGRRWWPALVAYPLAMAFTLVYSGEHWIIDVLAGWGYAAGVLALVGGAERWWVRSHRRLVGVQQRDLPEQQRPGGLGGRGDPADRARPAQADAVVPAPAGAPQRVGVGGEERPVRRPGAAAGAVQPGETLHEDALEDLPVRTAAIRLAGLSEDAVRRPEG
jgi:membrane-associated phospholipid phosphatase